MTSPVAPIANEPLLTADAAPHALRSVALFAGGCVALAGAGAAATPLAPGLVPFVLAFGPAILAFGAAAAEGRGSARRLARLLWRRPTSARWYLLVALPVGMALATVAIGAALGVAADDVFADVLPSLIIVPLVVLLPAFAEEIAWRGFAVPRLSGAMSPLAAALLLAIPWTVMHLALHVPGAMNAGAAVWPTVVTIVAFSVVLTWAFVGSGGSVLLVALVHAGLNGVVPLMRGIDPEASWAIRAIVAGAVAIAVVALVDLRRRPAPPVLGSRS
jgi:membrane protease YdiL (CAAX protease family)